MLDKQKLILSKINLTSITKPINKPLYDLESIKPGIIHLGLGNFHRAHQALYLDDLFNMGLDHDWGIVGSGVMPVSYTHLTLPTISDV